jgi:hypothetical protein
LCCLHFRVPDLGVTLPKTYHLGYTLWWVGGKTPIVLIPINVILTDFICQNEMHGIFGSINCYI